MISETAKKAREVNKLLLQNGVVDRRACTRCGDIKEIEEFSYRRDRFRHYYCKSCVKDYYKQWATSNTCIDCGAPITPRSTRCRPCAHAALRKEPNRCVDCGTEIARKSTRCRMCSLEHLWSDKDYVAKMKVLQASRSEELSAALAKRHQEGKMAASHSPEANHRRSLHMKAKWAALSPAERQEWQRKLAEGRKKRK